MKKFIILALGLSMVLGQEADARSKHKYKRHRHHDRDYDRDRVVISVGSPGYRYVRPPRHVYRGWRPGRIYTYNDHRYHWHGGSWVIYSPGRRVYHY